MNGDSLVSLIIPLYNAEKYVFRMMDSLINQTYNHIQLILVNDGSKDSTEQIVLSYKEILEKKGFIFDYIYQENKGVGGAINTGLKHVDGKYLCWADQDDYFESSAFKLRVDYMDSHDDCNALTCDAYYRNISDLNKKRIVGNFPDADNPKQFYKLLNYDSMFCPGCHMIRVAALKKVNPNMDIFEDKRGQNWQLLLPIYYKYDRKHLSIPIYNYIIHKGSVSHFDKDYEKEIEWYDTNYDLIRNTIDRMLISDEEKDKIINYSKKINLSIKLEIAYKYKEKEDYNRFYLDIKNLGGIKLKNFIKKYILLIKRCFF